MRSRGFHLIFGLIVLSLIGSLLWLAISSVSTLASRDASETAVTEPPSLSSSTEILNPMRGQYRWGGTNKWGSFQGQLFPSAANPGYRDDQQWPGAKISYYRFTWDEVQPAPDDFSFKRIEAELANAAARGEKLGFRVMPADSCCAPMTEPLTILPPWLSEQGVNQWTYRGYDSAAVVPDWNNARYLTAMTQLITELGKKYDGDPRIAFVDMLGYGNFGEWHSYPMKSEYPRGQGGQNDISPENAKTLVEANVQAFRRTRLLTLTANQAAFDQAISARADIGIRMDCLGDATGGSAFLNIMSNPLAANRWQSAPIVSEWCASNYTQAAEIPEGPQFDFFREDVGQDLYQVGREQVERWRISLLSSGNFPLAYNGEMMSDGQWQNFVEANKASGYRYSVASAEMPTQAAPGSDIQVSTVWTNSGVAPTYEAWEIKVELQLVGASTPIASTTSSLDLRTLYRAEDVGGTASSGATRTVTDQLSIPAGTPSGNYQVVIRAQSADTLASPEGISNAAPASGLALETSMPQVRIDEYAAGTVSVND